ncbi:Nucleoporin-like protein [Emericellopsis cladophorae]|uniref:Nucleoporin-like protein n=1 Tax=Emericellopsis cladophorae TaxID=2686198 RepID=A0A9P9Y7W8_9HYPO|nr:Nucleoporin-like protein [Emericellopsis cladophorae]KAI6785172.1 Nucleoporin-like protein [Emericellopsis cladophorae]
MSGTISAPPSPSDDKPSFDLNLQHGHKDLVQSIAFNTYGDRCATGSVDGSIRVFNRARDGTWRLCDTWTAHGADVLELQWLPATVYPNLLASLGIEGWFRLWAEDPSAAPGRRFSSGGQKSTGRPAFDTRSAGRAPYRSFSVRHVDDGAARHTYLALLAADGRLSIFENDQPENLTEYTPVDEFFICPRPARGEEVSFTVRFDPSPEPCYAAIRAGVPSDALGLVVAGMSTVKVYRSRDVVTTSYGVQATSKEFYLAAEITGHRGLVRDVAWAPGNIRGYDIIATACQDGYARVFKLETPLDVADADGKSWSATALLKPDSTAQREAASTAQREASDKAHGHHPSTLSASLAKSGANAERQWTGQPGQVRHEYTEISKLESHRTPIWRVGFDDDGQILATTGDDGKLLCYRQKPDGTWAKSSELAMMKTRMAVP